MDEHDDPRVRPARTVLRDDSDSLLRAVEELRALEKEKRSLEISSRPFHALARRVEEKAREVFRLAEQQEDDGDSSRELKDHERDSPPDDTIDATPRSG